MFEIGLTLLILGAIGALVAIIGGFKNFGSVAKNPSAMLNDVERMFDSKGGGKAPSFFGKHLFFAACGSVGGLLILVGVILMIVSKIG